MSRIRSTSALVLLAGTLLVSCAANAGPSGDLDKQVADLQERVKSLEDKLKSMEAQLPPSPQQENAAMALAQAAQTAAAAGDIDTAKAKLAELAKDYPRTRAAGSAQNLQRELAVVGKTSPPTWDIDKWYQGESDIVLDGKKATLVVFWETWCPHCRREVPKLEKMWTDYKGQGLQVIALTRLTKGGTDAKVQEVIDENKLSYPMAKENGQMASYFGVAGIPAAAVVKDGKVVWRGHPARITDAMLEDWL